MKKMSKWIGKKFVDFCRSDLEDERKINYEMLIEDTGEKMKFTSEDTVSAETMKQIRKSTIRKVRLANNEWYVSLECKEEKEMQGNAEKMVIEEKKRFMSLSKEVMPLLREINEKLEKYGYVKSTYITLNPEDGYMSFEPRETEWELRKFKGEQEAKICLDIREKVELEETEA